MSNTSIGPGPVQGGNENHAGDPTHHTLGETVPGQEPPAGVAIAPAGAAGEQSLHDGPGAATERPAGRKPAPPRR